MLGMLDMEIVDMLGVKCNTVELQNLIRELNEQIMEENFHANKKSNSTLVVARKDKYKIDYFLAGLERKPVEQKALN